MFALHGKLVAYSSEKYIQRFSKILYFIEEDLLLAKCQNWSVEHVRVGTTTFKERYLTLSNSVSKIEQIMIVEGQANSYDFSIALPMAVGLLLPYRVEITLNTPIDCVA